MVAVDANSPMQLVVVCTVADGKLSALASISIVLEECMDIQRMEWKAGDGVAVFQGQARVSLAVTTSKLYTSEDTKGCVQSIAYHQAG